MAHFDKLLDSSDKRMDYDYEKPEKMDALKMLVLKAKSAPGKGLALASSWEATKYDNDALRFKNKTELSQSCADNQYVTKFTATSKDYTLNMKVSPSNMNKDGQKTSFEGEWKCIPQYFQQAEWEAHASGRFGGFAMGPLTPWTNVQFNAKQKGEQVLRWDQNLVFDKNMHAAWRCDYDIVNKKLKATWGYLALMNTDHGNFYFRSNCLKRLCALGANYKVGSWGTHSAEVQYDFLNKENKGIKDMPMFMRFGADYKLSNGCSIAYKLNWGQKCWLTVACALPVNQGMKVTIQDRMSLFDLINDPAKAAYSWGMAVEFSV